MKSLNIMLNLLSMSFSQISFAGLSGTKRQSDEISSRQVISRTVSIGSEDIDNQEEPPVQEEDEHDSIIEVLQTMLKRESLYRVPPYLQVDNINEVTDDDSECDTYKESECNTDEDTEGYTSEDTLNDNNEDNDNDFEDETPFEVDVVAREKIIEWKYQVVDHYDLNRKIVAWSTNLLDRYLEFCKNSPDPVDREVFYNKKRFQLAAMTSFGIALKLGEPGKITFPTLIELSRGFFEAKHMVEEEARILAKLSFRMHPPLEMDYAYLFLDLLKPDNFLNAKILDQVKFLSELSQLDCYFIPFSAAKVMFAAMIIAIEEQYEYEYYGNTYLHSVDKKTKTIFYEKVAMRLGLCTNSPEITQLINQLRQLRDSQAKNN